MNWRTLSLTLLLSWQAALCSVPEAWQAAFGAVSSVVVGGALLVLLVGAAEDMEATSDWDDETWKCLAACPPCC